MIKGNLNWKPGKSFEKNFAHGVDLSIGVDSVFLVDGKGTSEFSKKEYACDLQKEFYDIVGKGCELHLIEHYRFTADDIEESYKIGIGGVLNKKTGEAFDPQYERIDPDRLRARRRRGRELRKAKRRHVAQT